VVQPTAALITDTTQPAAGVSGITKKKRPACFGQTLPIRYSLIFDCPTRPISRCAAFVQKALNISRVGTYFLLSHRKKKITPPAAPEKQASTYNASNIKNSRCGASENVRGRKRAEKSDS
jgi:hypothetical protein